MNSKLAGLVAFLAGATFAGCAGGAADGSGWTPDGEVLSPGDHVLTLTHEGRRRSYRVHVPSRLEPGRPAPLVLAFHGGGGNAEQFQSEAGLDGVADREGFLVAYPDGTGPLGLHTWNAGPRCCGAALAAQVDDAGFARAVVADLGRRSAVDRRRVYATGHSNGGGMAWRLAVEAHDLVAAVAPVGGAAMGPIPRTSFPVPLLHIHSVDDPRALYEGGLGPPFPLTDHRVEHRPVPEVLAEWASVNGCRGGPDVEETVRPSITGPDRGHAAERLAWRDCFEPLQHWRLRGAGHGWPGARVPRTRERLIGASTSVIDAAEEVWRFFDAVGW